MSTFIIKQRKSNILIYLYVALLVILMLFYLGALNVGTGTYSRIAIDKWQSDSSWVKGNSW